MPTSRMLSVELQPKWLCDLKVSNNSFFLFVTLLKIILMFLHVGITLEFITMILIFRGTGVKINFYLMIE